MKPMLASPPDPKHPIRFPVVASPKIDGIRAMIHDGVVLSRSLKPIRNKHVQDVLGRPFLNGLDGELVVGSPTDPNCMQNTTSGVMRVEGEPEFVFYVFDKFDMPTAHYRDRETAAHARLRDCNPNVIRWLDQTLIGSAKLLDEYEALCLEAGYEGVMIRDPKSLYKFGRATAKSQELLKIKRFVDDEAVIIGVEELYHNDNEAKTNELGRTQRSTAKAGLRAAGTLGKLIGRMSDGRIVQPGTGYTAKDRDDLWAAWNAGTLEGKLFTFKHFEQVGVKEAPRFPVFKSLRDASDLS